MRIRKNKNDNPDSYSIEDLTLSDLVVLKKAVEDLHTKAEDIRLLGFESSGVDDVICSCNDYMDAMRQVE